MPRLGSRKVKSKRETLKHKHKVEKKVTEHHRKMRRLARAQGAPKGGGLSKELGIPNLHPYKAQLVRRVRAAKEMVDESEKRRRERLRQQALRRGGEMDDGEGEGDDGVMDSMEALAAEAAARSSAFESAEAKRLEEEAMRVAEKDAAGTRAGEMSRRQFFKHLREVLRKADVLLEVLDARDPLGSRAWDVEKEFLSQGPEKKLVLVLNKCDLVPGPVVVEWLKYLRRSFPTLAFKASTQKQRKNLSFGAGAKIGRAIRAGEVITGQGSAGAEILLQLVKNYGRTGGAEVTSAFLDGEEDMGGSAGGGGGSGPVKPLVVGVIGYPNVGKSSLINTLLRSKSVGVSPTPGHTKQAQLVRLDSQIQLMDCPGIIFDADGESESGVAAASLLLRNVVSVDAHPDPEGSVGAILERCAPEKLCEVLAIPMFDSLDDLLSRVARKRGKLLRGDTPDTNAAARIILRMWNAGDIPFFTLPPDEAVEGESAAIVHPEMGAMDELYAREEEELRTEGRPMDEFVPVAPVVSTGMDDGSGGGELGGKKKKPERRAAPLFSEEEEARNPRAGVNRALRKDLRKGRRRAERAVLDAQDRGEAPDLGDIAIIGATEAELVKASGGLAFEGRLEGDDEADEEVPLSVPAVGIDKSARSSSKKKESYRFDEFL